VLCSALFYFVLCYLVTFRFQLKGFYCIHFGSIHWNVVDSISFHCFDSVSFLWSYYALQKEHSLLRTFQDEVARVRARGYDRGTSTRTIKVAPDAVRLLYSRHPRATGPTEIDFLFACEKMNSLYAPANVSHRFQCRPTKRFRANLSLMASRVNSGKDNLSAGLSLDWYGNKVQPYPQRFRPYHPQKLLIWPTLEGEHTNMQMWQACIAVNDCIPYPLRARSTD
jgi:hypothetical protein